MEPNISIRPACPDDLASILHHRRAMFEDMGYTDAGALNAMDDTCNAFFATALSEGSYQAWLAEFDGTVVGGGGVLVSPWPAHPHDARPRRATILNVFTELPFRRRGIARALMQAMIDWCRSSGFASVSLHASTDGKPLYEALGFAPTNEMRLNLR